MDDSLDIYPQRIFFSLVICIDKCVGLSYFERNGGLKCENVLVVAQWSFDPEMKTKCEKLHCGRSTRASCQMQ